MILIGDDFTFTNAWSSFEWMDVLIKQLNELSPTSINKTVRAIYSNLTYYFNAKIGDGATYKRFKGDFFPYA